MDLNMTRVLVSTEDLLTKNMFVSAGFEITNDPDKADLLCFTGGADVSPFLYGQRPLPDTYFNARRDSKEIALWKYVEPDRPKVGICRGSQLGNVLCGGTLWQNVDNHMSRHPVKDHVGFTKNGMLMVTSDHHQMCRLTKEAMVFATANRATRREDEFSVQHFGAGLPNDWSDPEAFYYSNFNFLGVQFHPEYQNTDMCRKYFFDLLRLCHNADYNMPQLQT